MTPEKLREMRLGMKMTQQEFGVALGMPKTSAGRSVRAYELGERPISGVLSKLLTYVEKHGF